MRYYVVLLLLACFFSCIKQKEIDYIAYYHQKNEANFYIINANFDSAEIVFDDIFQKYSKHFYKDIHNACLCAIELEEYDKALQY